MIHLSSAGLNNIILNSNEENSFCFLFGQQEIRMNNLFAEFISPNVSNLHQMDPTINYLKIDQFSDNSSNCSELLNDIFTEDIMLIIKQISTGNPIEINQDQSIKLRLMSIVLGNEELFNEINKIFPMKLDTSNINFYLQQLLVCEHFQKYSKISFRFDYSSIYDFIAQNFISIEETKLLDFPKTILYNILSNKHLQIQDEDSLLDFIDNSFKNSSNQNEKYDKYDFYELIKFNSLSQSKFSEFVTNFDIEKMTKNMWKKFCNLLIQAANNQAIKRNGFQYDNNTNHRFNGIIHNLTKKCNKNVSDAGIVKVTVSSEPYSQDLAKYVVDLDDKEHYFHSSENENEIKWIKYDFGENRVHPTMYSIRSRHDRGKNDQHLQNWVIEGSNTGNDNEWKTLDTRNGITTLNDRNASDTFTIQTKLGENEYFRYLRLRMTGKNMMNRYSMVLSALEYFGIINEYQK